MKRILVLTVLAMLITAPAEAKWQITGNLRCASVHTEGNGTWNPQFIVANGCGDVVFWVMCVNYPSKVDNEYFEGTLQPGEKAWIETYPEVAEEFGAFIHFQTLSNDVEYPTC
jgi:hypothetical protein